ncbi:MAG: hypothetical protein ACXW5U_01220 [Thermoanaerobaculia bacterium]
MTALNLKPIHPFPARMAPAIAFDALPELGRPLRVLDPMAGSGTTLVAARLRGHEPFGFDTDPLAVLISKAWCAEFDPVDFERLAEDILCRARAVYRSLKLGDAYPAAADDETRAFVRYWFDGTSRRQLAALAISIEAQTPATDRDLLWVAFSRLIITKAHGSSLAMDVSHSRPHRVYDRAPALPFDNFRAQSQRVAAANPFAGKNRTTKPRALIRLADARKLPLDDASIDLVITSPPYLNAIDYLRGHKLSLVWMGHTIEKLRAIRTANIGTEVSTLASLDEGAIADVAARMGPVDALSTRHRGMLARYIGDLDAMMAELARVLRPSGRAVLVVGNSTLKGTFIRNSEAVRHLAKRYDFSLERSRRRPLPDDRRYLPPPSSAAGNTLHARMREEVIVELRR